MIKYKTVTKEQVVWADVICNRCGESCRSGAYADDYEYAGLNARWGYGSDSDGQEFHADICEKCFYEIIKDFKLPPEKTIAC